jgi:two-component system sensor histidine kinase QseC
MTLPNSLAFRLVSTLLVAAILFGGIAGYASYQNALHENDEIFDAQMAQVAQTLLAIGTFADGEHPADPGKVAHKYQNTLYFQLWREENKELYPLLTSRDNGLDFPFFQNLPEGFSDQLVGAQRWRFFRQRQPEQSLDVIVGQDDQARNELAKEIAWNNIAPFVYGLPVLGFLASVLVIVGLRPLYHLALELNRRSDQAMTPLDVEHLPRELRPPVEAMNGLLLELSRAFDRERRFTSDAAHELRTPLAALRAQLDVASLEQGTPEVQLESIKRASLAARRMERLVTQLLLMCRLDVSAHLDRAPVMLDEIAQQVCADLGPDAVSKQIDISLIAEPAPLENGNQELLYVLLRNLIDNAIRYTPRQGEIALNISKQDGNLIVEVSDSGCGVSIDDMQWLGQRFRRFSASQAEGVGLGLSIVARVADLHRATVEYKRSSLLGGLLVTVRFDPMHH